MGVNISIRYPELIAAGALLEVQHAIHLQSQAQVEHLKPVFSFCILGSCSEKKNAYLQKPGSKSGFKAISSLGGLSAQAC